MRLNKSQYIKFYQIENRLDIDMVYILYYTINRKIPNK